MRGLASPVTGPFGGGLSTPLSGRSRLSLRSPAPATPYSASLTPYWEGGIGAAVDPMPLQLEPRAQAYLGVVQAMQEAGAQGPPYDAVSILHAPSPLSLFIPTCSSPAPRIYSCDASNAILRTWLLLSIPLTRFSAPVPERISFIRACMSQYLFCYPMAPSPCSLCSESLAFPMPR